MLKINVYQIRLSETDGPDSAAWQAAFMGLDKLKRFGLEVNPANYGKVWSGTIDGDGLEDVFYIFNCAHPADFCGHSLSVSDVVEVLEGSDMPAGFYFCDSFGWKRLENWSRAPERKKRKGYTTLCDTYRNAAPVGVVALSSFGGLAVLEVMEGDGVLVAAWDFGAGYDKIRRHKIQETTGGRAFIRKGGRRFYLDEIMRV